MTMFRIPSNAGQPTKHVSRCDANAVKCKFTSQLLVLQYYPWCHKINYDCLTWDLVRWFAVTGHTVGIQNLAD